MDSARGINIVKVPFDSPVNQPNGDSHEQSLNIPPRDKYFSAEELFDNYSSGDDTKTVESYFDEIISIPHYRRVTWFQQATLRLMVVVFLLSMGCVGFVAYHAKNSFESNVPSFQAFLSWLLLH